MMVDRLFRVTAMERKRWIAAAFALTLFSGLAWFLLRPPNMSLGAANGSYEHDCCGTVELRNGIMSFGTEKKVRYVVGRDEAGPYVLPATFVGTWEDRGFQIDGSTPARNLRLDKLPRPDRIELFDIGRSYKFTRKAPLLGRRGAPLKAAHNSGTLYSIRRPRNPSSRTAPRPG